MARKTSASKAEPTPKKENAAQLIQTVRRQTRTKYSAEDKIRIILEGLRGDHPVAELCRREWVSVNVYYNWLKEYMEPDLYAFSHSRTVLADTKGRPALPASTS